MNRFEIQRFEDQAAVRCPCGIARRAFAGAEGSPASVHLVEILEDARVHYHKKLTEIYVILEAAADARMELDGAFFAVKAFETILIKPGCRHRAVGRMKVLNIAVPVFDPADEWFD